MWIFLNFLHEDILPYIVKSDKAIIKCLDNWVNETNLYEVQDIQHFNDSNITFLL